MSVCRPRGGRAAPRYHDIKLASEDRLWRLMHNNQEEEPPPSKTDELVLRMKMYERAMDGMLAATKEKLK